MKNTTSQPKHKKECRVQITLFQNNELMKIWKLQKPTQLSRYLFLNQSLK